MYEAEAGRALELTAGIIGETGPRLVGSEACKLGARRLAEAAAPVCDSVAVEPFAVHPGSFLGFIRVMVVLYACSAPLLALAPWASVLLMSAGLAVLVFGFFLYKPLLDPFYPRLEGLNVVGSVEPSGEVKRQVIVSGHHDSARIFNFFVDRPELYSRRIYGGMGAYAALWLASVLLAALAGPAVRLAAAAAFVLAFALLVPLWRFASKEGTPGAGDNLASSATALEIARLFRVRRDRGEGLASTRVVFVSFDGEEAGLRGAKAYAAAHRTELATIPTFALNMDCVYRRDKLRLLLSDLNGSVELDGPAARLIAAKGEAEGIRVEAMPIAFLTGGTDAAELAKAGVRTASLMGMDWSNQARSSVYHTPGDTVDSVESAAVEAAIRLGARFVEAVEADEL